VEHQLPPGVPDAPLRSFRASLHSPQDGSIAGASLNLKVMPVHARVHALQSCGPAPARRCG